MRRQNWLQVFASFDPAGEGQLQDTEFERAVTSMALGLSDTEIREVREHLQQSEAKVPVQAFGTALQRVDPAVTQREEWGRSVLAELCREAAKAERGSGRVTKGADV